MNLNDFLDEISEPQIDESKSLSTVSIFQAGERVFNEGDLADDLYIVHSGKMGLSIEKSGKQYLINELQAGDIFGEMALINNDTRSATATAITDTELLSAQPEHQHRSGRHTYAVQL